MSLKRSTFALGATMPTVLAAMASPALAQAKNPFSVGISEGGGSTMGLTGWILAQQGWFEHQLAATVRAAKIDGSALWTLIGLSLVYGVFHAAGPGHGKAVLTSYMVANERALRRGIVLSFLAALLQGLVAITLVGVLALALHVTAQRMKDAASLVETASFAGIALLGAWLVWRKGRALLRVWRLHSADLGSGGLSAFMSGGSAVTSLRSAQPGFALAGSAGSMATQGRFSCVMPDAAHAATCEHCHAPDPSRLGEASLSWREAAATVAAAGARPCSGAILVLVFALAQGMFVTGIAAVLAMSFGVAVTTATLASLAVLAKTVARRLARPGSRTAAIVLSGFEFAAAAVVLLVGVGLLTGSILPGGA